MPYTTEIISNLEDLTPLAADWDLLAARFHTPLLRFDWFHAAALSFCPPGELAIFVLRSHGELAAIATLVINPKYGFPRYELLGASLLREPSGFLYRDQASLSALIERITRLGTPVCLDGLSADAEEAVLLKEARGYHPRYSAVGSFASPWIPTRACWEQYYASISASWRSSLRRSEKRAKELGAVAYEMIAPDPGTVDALMHEVFEVESAGWKSRIGTAMQANERLGAFFSAYARRSAAAGKLRIAFLRINGKAVAVQLLVEDASRLWVFKIGYDELYARCSPGILLMHHVIHQSFERGVEAVELLGTNQKWLDIWPNELHHYQDFFLHRFAPSAIITHGIEVSDRVLSRLRTSIAKSRKLSPQRTLAGA
jgi:CelD/BcsL family acetyltransferase involved in cellulose biosynthesis